MMRRASTTSARVVTLLGFAILAWWANGALAQQQQMQEVPGKSYRYMDFDAGDLDDRMHVYAAFHGVENPRILMVSPDALSGEIYLETLKGEQGWLHNFADAGWNSYATDLVACGNAPQATTDDLVVLTEKSIYGMYRVGMATRSQVLFGPGLGAAFVIKLRSTTPEAVPAAILLDPYGPRGAQPMLELSPAEIIARRAGAIDRLWREWGIGPEVGKSYPDSDIGEAGYRQLLEMHKAERPRYWAAVLTELDAWLRVDEPRNLKDFPVLILRSPHRSPEEIERENAVAAWLEERGALVERFELASLGLPGLSALPMCGSNATAVSQFMLEWMERLPLVQEFRANAGGATP